MATIAGKIFVDGIDVEKGMSFGIQFGELLAAALRKNRMARIAIACLNRPFSVWSFMVPIMTTEATRPIFMADVFGVGPPISFHFGKKVRAINSLDLVDERGNLRRA